MVFFCVRLFICLFVSYFSFLPCLLINSITYVEHRRKIAHTQTLKHVALYSSFFIVQHHHRAISFSHARNYEWCVCLCMVYSTFANIRRILRLRPNPLCNSVNALSVRSFVGSLGRVVRSFNTLAEFGGLSFRSSGSHTFPHVLHFITLSQRFHAKLFN